MRPNTALQMKEQAVPYRSHTSLKNKLSEGYLKILWRGDEPGVTLKEVWFVRKDKGTFICDELINVKTLLFFWNEVRTIKQVTWGRIHKTVFKTKYTS